MRSEGMIGSISKWKPDSKRPRGRLRQRWMDRVQEDFKLLNVRNAERCEKYIERWRQYVVAAWVLKASKSIERRKKMFGPKCQDGSYISALFIHI